jgi:hypothetical protein
MWSKWPYWLKGGLISIIYLLVLIPLSSLCPSESSECFTDIFKKTLLLPLAITASLFPGLRFLVLEHSLVFLFSFWIATGIIYGLLYGLWKNNLKKANQKKLDVKENFEDEIPKPTDSNKL